MDGPTDTRSLPVRQSPKISDPRPTRLLRRCIPPDCSRDENSRGTDGSTFALAERIRGTVDWLNPEGMPGPRDRAHRGGPAENSTLLLPLPRALSSTSHARERPARVPRDPASGTRGCSGTAGGRWPPSPLRAPRRLTQSYGLNCVEFFVPDPRANGRKPAQFHLSPVLNWKIAPLINISIEQSCR